MSDVLDMIYRLRDMAGKEAARLSLEVAKAQAVLDRLEAFANDAEATAELAAASDMFPNASANIPARSGLVRLVNGPWPIEQGTAHTHWWGLVEPGSDSRSQCSRCGVLR
ncbi:MAG: hypothetical protein H7Y33_05405 [Cytophagales bacterium]|nr:hypothetical protein [Rhizobacter sp.]